MSIIFIIAVVAGVVYLLCDALEKYAAVQELSRMVFFAAMLALLLGFK